MNSLSSNEIINYAYNGTIAAIPANVFLSIIREYEDKLSEAVRDYDSGYDDGWAEAVEEMREHLSKM